MKAARCNCFRWPHLETCATLTMPDQPIPPALRAVDTDQPATARQEGGGHYKDLPIQPVQYIHANGVGYFEGNVIKYVTRWRAKNGVEDLRKARHYLDLLIELEGAKS
jgi:hypothetical protein